MTDATRVPPQGRPTLYRGIPMRSRLEADFARMLDADGATWEYEPQCFASPDGQYLPDFRWQLTDDLDLYVEVKPATLSDDELADALRKMQIIWASIPDAYISLFLWTYGAEELGDYWSARGEQRWWFFRHDDELKPIREA